MEENKDFRYRCENDKFLIYDNLTDKDMCAYFDEESKEVLLSALNETAEITTSKKDLLDCIHNLMGIFDTPVGRRRFSDKMSEEIREIGRKIMNENGRGNFNKNIV